MNVMKRIVLGVGRFVDWLGLRLILLLVTGLVAYAVLQPLIWSQVLHKAPPATSSDLANLMVIVVTIMSLALAGFGVVVYQLAERRSEARLNRRARELQDDLRMDAAIANARLYLMIGVQAFLSYDELWRDHQYSLAELTTNRELKDFLESAIRNSRYAKEELEKLSSDLLRRPECAPGLLACKGNYAYFLATRGLGTDKGIVIDIARELDRPGINIQKQDTVAWAFLRFSEPGQRQWNKGLSTLAALMKRDDLEHDHADTLRARYGGVFKRNGEVPADLQNALAGTVPA